MASPPPTPDDLASFINADSTLGPLLIGSLVSMALWGVTGVQTLTFFINNTRDRPVFKALIGFLYVADTFHALLCCHVVYHYLISNWMNPVAPLIPAWSVLLTVAATSIIDFFIRSLFIRRLYRLSDGNIPLAVLIAALSIGDLVLGLLITARAFQLDTWIELEELSTVMYLNFAFGTSSDLILAAALCYFLYRSRTGLPKTNSIITTLIAYTVNTSLIVAIDAALGIILYAAMSHNFVFLGFYFILSKRTPPPFVASPLRWLTNVLDPTVYLNSYLASLNARESLRAWSNEPVSIGFGGGNTTASQSTELVSHHVIREKRSQVNALKPEGPTTQGSSSDFNV